VAAETGLLINGRIYEMPDVASFTLDECQVLYDYCGLTLEDFVPLEGETDDEHLARIETMMRNPGWRRTILHVAYQRGNPKIPASRVKDLVGSANWIEPFAAMGDDEPEDDAAPLGLTSEPSEASPSSLPESGNSSRPKNETDGNGSTTDGDEPDGTPAGTGALRSVTSPISPQEISAA